MSKKQRQRVVKTDIKSKDTPKIRKTKKKPTSPSSTKKHLTDIDRILPGFVKNYLQKHPKLTFVLRWGLRFAALAILALILLFAYVAKDLPSPDQINSVASEQTTKIYDRTGQTVIYELYGDINRTIINFDQMPDTIKQATVAVEDKDFYRHGAFSVRGFFRAIYINLSKRGTQGGSTITQQYVKNALLSNEQTLIRKFKELILAIEIEQVYPKDDILKLYLNEIPYGSNIYGIQAASQAYFAKDASELDYSQAALLAALPQAPTYYWNNKEALIGRQQHILKILNEQGYIDQETYQQNLEKNVLAEIKYNPARNNTSIAPHYVDVIRAQLEEKFGVKAASEGGYKVISTLDLQLQDYAKQAVDYGIDNVRAYGGSNAALVSTDPKTGEILAMVGSYDYEAEGFGNFNVATARRQPGSSFKPIVQASLYKKNYGPGDTVYDVKTDFGNYVPENYDLRQFGVQSFRTALQGSLNISAVKALYLSGVDNALQTARDLGITTLDADYYGLSLTLGAAEVPLYQMVSAYGTFANQGVHIDPTYILEIIDSRGKSIEKHDPNASANQALDPEIAYLVSNVLSDNNARAYIFGTSSNLYLPGHNVAAKTGTTENYRDGWTLGYTPSIVAGVWAGNNDNTSMAKGAGGSSAASPIWNYFMNKALEGKGVEEFSRPAGIKEVTLDAYTGKLPTSSTKVTRKDLFPSWYQPRTSEQTNRAVIDKVSGLLATECTPAQARVEISGASIQAEIPPEDPNYQAWAGPVAALAASLGESSGVIPTKQDNVHKCDDTLPSVSIAAGSSDGVVIINATKGTHVLSRVDLYRDGNKVKEFSIPAGGGTINYTDTGAGSGSHSYYAIVIDQALYQTQGNTIQQSTTPNSSIPTGTISCAINACSVSAQSSGNTDIASIELFYNSVSQGIQTSQFSWNGYNPSFPAGAVVAVIIDDNGQTATVSY
ncbi:transglycosylase domain-containing protein [Candidatus Saccharibacteria bacterium]|nr:transglycosylase domain-containing protein [Candidatus Saccharibacteria bacterium]MCB9834860.1 transglycosylase domain-containing protein [Candidatus Nomurabacteria bacterium]